MSDLKCLSCGKPMSGRTDKKYCSDQCRFEANNKHKMERESQILSVNKVLRKNRTILKSLCPVGKATVRKEVLDAMGYDYSRFTSLFTTTKKEIYYICYDYVFMPVRDENNVEKALIVTKQDYMKPWDPWRFVKKRSD